MLMEKLSIKRDINGIPTYAIDFAFNKFQGILTNTGEQTLIVPASPYADFPNVMVFFSYAAGASIWVSVNQSCTLPTGAIEASTSEQNPAPRAVNAGDVLHFKTNDVADEFGVTFYAY